jgi:hypothetical protein
VKDNAARQGAALQNLRASTSTPPYSPTAASPATSKAVFPPPAIADQVDAVEVFAARCWARGYLVRAGWWDFHAAVDGLQQAALTHGLVAALGQDAVQAILAKNFAASS